MTADLEPTPGYDTPADLTGITELRVHGVSGTPPAAMLQFPVPEQVVPGRLTGFYRRPR